MHECKIFTLNSVIILTTICVTLEYDFALNINNHTVGHYTFGYTLDSDRHTCNGELCVFHGHLSSFK